MRTFAPVNNCSFERLTVMVECIRFGKFVMVCFTAVQLLIVCVLLACVSKELAVATMPLMLIGGSLALVSVTVLMLLLASVGHFLKRTWDKLPDFAAAGGFAIATVWQLMIVFGSSAVGLI